MKTLMGCRATGMARLTLVALALGACGKGGAGGGRPEAISKALATAQQASVNAAEVTECALTEVARPTGERRRIVWKVDAAETATRAATRALGAAVKLNDSCRDQWNTDCDHLIGIVETMTSSTQETREMACAPPPPAPADAGRGQ